MKDLALELRTTLEYLAAKEGGEMFFERPERWWDTPTWRCVNEHVSTRYLKTEVKGACCLACFEPVFLTFPEDLDGPLSVENPNGCASHTSG